MRVRLRVWVRVRVRVRVRVVPPREASMSAGISPRCRRVGGEREEVGRLVVWFTDRTSSPKLPVLLAW